MRISAPIRAPGFKTYLKKADILQSFSDKGLAPKGRLFALDRPSVLFQKVNQESKEEMAPGLPVSAHFPLFEGNLG